MAGYKARQVAAIEAAVVAGRRALRAAGRYEPLIFAEAFVAAGGVQLPGEPGAESRTATAGQELLRALRAGRRDDPDPLLRRELQRALSETAWAEAAADDRVVGFRLELNPACAADPACDALTKQDHGFGRNLFPKMAVVVLPPQADGSRFVPVTQDEMEC